MRRYRAFMSIVGALAVAIYFLWPSIMGVVVQEALRSAQKQGARISWEGLTVSGFTVTVDSFGAWFPGPPLKGGIRPPIKVELEHSQAHVKPLSLLLFDPVVDFVLHAYGGSIEGTAGVSGDKPRLSANFESVDLAKHEQLHALGLTSALLSGSVTDLQRLSQDAVQGSFDLVVSRIQVPRIPPALSLVKLEPLEDGEIHLRGAIDQNAINLDEVKIDSSYGGAHGACKARNLSQRGSESAEGEFQVRIGDTLHPQISPFLPMLSNNVLRADTRRFTARMRGFPCSRAPRALGDVALGSLCVRFTPVAPQ